MKTKLNTLRAVGEKIHNPGTKVSRKSPDEEFPDKNVRYDAIERRTIIDEEHPDVCYLCVPGAPELCEVL